MEIVVVGSSSAGNSMLLCADEGALLIDVGFSMKEVRARLARHGASLDTLKAVLITHEHSDHASGVGRFLHARGATVAANAATALAIHHTFGADGVAPLEVGQARQFGPFKVTAIRVPHDSADCCAFEVEVDGRRLLYATDLGAVPEELIQAGARCDCVVLESNHDRSMLWAGSYPKFLKERIAGGRGHLSNEQAGEAVARMAGGPLKKVVLGHLSVENNRPQLAVDAVRSALRRRAGLAGFSVEVVAAPKDGPQKIAIP
jgi:phosphoribosyl 1,2-cyclic phosphodiesterase